MRKLSLLAPFIAAVVTTSCGNQTAQLSFVSISPALPQIGDVVTVTFKVLDYRGVALAGQDVNFRLDSDKPGVKLEPTSTQSLKGSGLAETQIVVTGTASAVIVVATSGDKEVRSPPISFAGTTASARGMTFQCGEFAGTASGGVHALGTYDQSRNLIAGSKLNCHAHIADRNGDGIPGAVVSFLVEAGTIGGSGTSVADVVGNADILYKTSYPLPWGADTGPRLLDPGTFTWQPMHDASNTGELLVPLWMEPYRWTTNPFSTITMNIPPAPVMPVSSTSEPRRNDPIRKKAGDGSRIVNNPRDNVVTLIAFTSGEEDYYDLNNNGKYDSPQEPFVDLAEPFVDANDNGTYDAADPMHPELPGELFVDLNGDGVWSPANGTWDANTIIWKQEKITWTGIPNLEEYLNPEPTVRSVQSADGLPILIDCMGSYGVNLLVSDPWFNSLAENDEGDGCVVEKNDTVTSEGGQTGRPFTYPPVRFISFDIKDALDRMPAPMSNQPGCFEPPAYRLINWEVAVGCTFTSSPFDGYKVELLGFLKGSSVNNLPVQ